MSENKINEVLQAEEKKVLSMDRVIPGWKKRKETNLVKSTLSEDKKWKRSKVKFVHVTMKRGNTFVTVTDARGNKKIGGSAGCLEGFKRGKSRRSRYAANVIAEHVGRSSINLRMNKSLVMKVKGSTYFRKKKGVILSWREGYKNKCKLSKGVRGQQRVGDPQRVGGKQRVQSKIMYIRDVTQIPHNGCRLPKKRRI